MISLLQASHSHFFPGQQKSLNVRIFSEQLTTLGPLSITKQHGNMQFRMLLYNSLTGYSNAVCNGRFPLLGPKLARL